MFLSALILTAPIHCRDTDAMLNISKSHEEANLDLKWPEDEYLIDESFLGVIRARALIAPFIRF